jgi:hypothetical protein
LTLFLRFHFCSTDIAQGKASPMASAQKQNAGIHARFVVAAGIAAAAGFLWGWMRQEAPTTGEQGAASAKRHRERTPRAMVLSPTANEFVREVIKGAIDERQQWRMVRGFTEEELKSAIAKMDRRLMASSDFPEMLFHRWGELDPVAANEAAKAMDPKGFSDRRRAVFAAWIKQGGGVAAWNAVCEEGQMWDCTRSVPGEVADMLVASLSDRDDPTAFKEVLRLDDGNCNVADLLCRARAGKASESPESRAAFLKAAALHPDPYVIYCARKELFKQWAMKDVKAARTGAMALSLDEEELESVRREIDSVERDEARDAERAAGDER